MLDAVSWVAIRTFARLTVARRVRLRVEGLERVPAGGPALIASRHYHHLYDGLVLLSALGRQTHFLVALDWVRGRRGRLLMETVCGAARWPVVLRSEELARQARPAYRSAEVQRYLRQGLAGGAALLREGRILVVFPEAYPNIDPDFTLKEGEEMLPFRPGFARLAALASRGGAPVPVLPAGLEYRSLTGEQWEVTLRFGAPLLIPDAGRDALRQLVRRVEADVSRLSGTSGVLRREGASSPALARV